MNDQNNNPFQLNNLIHEPSRLLILSILKSNDFCEFSYLLSISKLTKGNLSSHLSKLEEAGIVTILKTYEGRTPKTIIRMTVNGRKLLEDYKKSLKDILKILS